jgi:hypothetical protein
MIPIHSLREVAHARGVQVVALSSHALHFRIGDVERSMTVDKDMRAMVIVRHTVSGRHTTEVESKVEHTIAVTTRNAIGCVDAFAALLDQLMPRVTR